MGEMIGYRGQVEAFNGGDGAHQLAWRLAGKQGKYVNKEGGTCEGTQSDVAATLGRRR